MSVSRQRLGLLVTTALTAAVLATRTVGAQDATWLANPGSGNYSDAANWSPAATPTGTAIFGTSTVTTITMDNVGTIGGLQLDAGAPAYTFNVSNSMDFAGAGIVNNSAEAPVVNVDGTGFITLYSGSLANATIVNGGFIDIRSNSTGATARYVGNGGQLNTNSVTTSTTLGSIEGNGVIQFGTRQLVVGGNNLSTTFSGALVGFAGGQFVKEGTGTLTLTSGNVVSSTTVTGGLINFNALSNFGSGTVTLNGGGLQWAAGNTADVSSRLTAIGGGGGTFDTNGNDVTLASTISGTGGLTKAGTGTLTLSAANTYSGDTTIAGGLVNFSTASNFGTGNVTLNGGGLQWATGASTDISSRLNPLGTSGGTVDTNGNSVTFATGLSGTGGLAKTGAGTLVLNAASSYTGGTVVNAGTLQLGAGGSLASTGALTVNGGTFDLDGQSQTVGALSGAGGTIALGSGSLTTNSAANTALASTISGSGSLVKQGTGTLTLSAVNTYSGGTTVNGGLVNFAALDNFGTGNVTLDGGGVQWATGTATDISGRLNALGASGGTFDTNGNVVSFGTALTGTGGTLVKEGTGTLIFAADNSYIGTTTISGGTLQVGDGGTTGSVGAGAIANNAALAVNRSDNLTISNNMSGTGTLTKLGTNTLTMSGDLSGLTGTTTISGGTLAITGAMMAGDIVNNGTLRNDSSGSTVYAGSISGSGGLVQSGGQLVINGTNSYTGGTTIGFGGGIFVGTTSTGKIVGAVNIVDDGGGLFLSNADTTGLTTIDVGANTSLIFFNTTSASTAAITGRTSSQVRFDNDSSAGNATLDIRGRLRFQDNSTAGNATITNRNQLSFNNQSTGGTARYISTGGVMFVDVMSAGISLGSIEGNGGILLSNKRLTVGGNNLSTTFTGSLQGTGGSLTKEGTGTLTLSGSNSYSGGTTVTGGLVNFNAAGTLGTGTITLNGGGLQWAAGTTTDISARLAALGTNGGTFDTNGNNVTFATGLSGNGRLTKAGLGTLTLAGNNTFTGGTTVTGGTLAITGSITGAVGITGGLTSFNGNSSGADVTLSGTGIVGGTGTIGTLTMNGGTLAPGNSIGTLNVVGPFVQNGGVYQVEVNAAGQSDRTNVTGTATINGGTVQVIAEAGRYARNTNYTILTATGGLTGTYANVTANFAFLTPTLSYDANNVFLNLLASQSAFASGAQTPNQFAVGTALDRAAPDATGDFATVIDALIGLSTQQGPAALNAISGQNYSGFSTGLMQTSALFMSNFSGQAGGANRGSGRVALAEACDVSCDVTEPGKWGVWGGAIGATGSIGGSANAGTTTYNAGGFAAGLDYKLTPDLLVGVTVGYASGNQWVSGFSGRGWSGTVQTGLYASYTKGPIYFDALAGYAYATNNMVRQIVIPGLNARTAQGSTGANQFFGQVEGGYRFDIGGAPQAYVTPFVRLQASTATQNGFTESGADSLNLSVAQQTTNSLRSVVGAQLGGAINSFAAQLKLGWSHEFASTDRPVTAAFVGAPAIPFTTYGAAPNRDGVMLGFNATQAIGERTSLFVRYEGDISGSDNMHAGTVGVRLRW